MDSELYFEITDGPDIIKIEPLHWTHPNSDNDWDGNWIRSRVTVKGGAFRGQFTCDLFSSDFEIFRRELKTAYDNLKSTATFKTFEGQIEIKCVGDGLGHFTVDCMAMDNAGTGNKLKIIVSFDQTSIPHLLRQLNEITKTFPIQGTELNLRNE